MIFAAQKWAHFLYPNGGDRVSIEKTTAYKYALSCTEEGNDKVGRYIKKQAVNWLEIADGGSDTAYVNEKEWERIKGILTLMMHPDTGKNMLVSLEPYALWLIMAVFCTFRRDNRRRLYTTALLEISRKNYKTFTSAVIFIIAMLCEARFSRLFSVAPDYKLSSELRLAVRKIIKVSPLLVKHFKITREMITCQLTDTEYTPLAYSNDRMDGKLATIFLADEAGALDSYPVEAMRSSQITLKNKLGIIISTQYPNENNVLIDEIDLAKKMLDGIVEIDSVFALLYEPDDELIKDWETDDRVIYQSNPVAVRNSDVFDEIKKMRTMAALYENKRENYLCKHNNIRYKGVGSEGYVNIDAVRLCAYEHPGDWWNGRTVYLGVDLSQTDDNTAVAMVTSDDEGLIHAAVFGFIPEERIDIKSKNEKIDYRRCIREGCCYGCGDEVIDYSFVEDFILHLEEKFGVTVADAGFDRYNAISTVQKLEAADNPINCTLVKQHSSVLHPATKLLKEYILSQKFRYEKNILLENSFENARCTEDTNLNKYVNKKRSAGKVDMVVALINAVYLLNENVLLDSGFVCQVI